MAILFDVHVENWITDEQLVNLMPNLTRDQIRIYPDIGDADDIIMLACDKLRKGLVGKLPNLQLVQKLGVGVETMVYDPDLPEGVKLTRLRAEETAHEMGRFCLGYILEHMNNIQHYRAAQSARRWSQKPPVKIIDVNVGILGLGYIGSTIAQVFSSLNFPVSGWSRSQKAIENVDCTAGNAGLTHVLELSDYVICVLPSTAETVNLFNLELFKCMKPNAMLINVGRGSLIVEADLIAALNSGYLAHAVLDVFQNEPLPEESALWSHPEITIAPHVSGWHLDSGLPVVRENYVRLIESGPLINEVDRSHGY